MQNISKQYNIDHNIELCDFIERYNKSVGMICNEYVGKYIIFYENNEYDIVNSLNDIKEPLIVKELYIDGLIISDNEIFHKFTNLERIHGVPILEITDMSSMFNESKFLTSVEKLGSWDTSKVTTIRAMFYNCESLKNIDLGGWDTSNCTDTSYMFTNCISLTDIGELGGWDTSSCTNMSHMFNRCTSLKNIGDLGCWNISRVTNMSSMFNMCRQLIGIGDIGSWDTSNVTSMGGMFCQCNSLICLGDLGRWNIDADRPVMFAMCKSLVHLGKPVNDLKSYRFK